MVVNNDNVESTLHIPSKPIVRQVDAPVPWIMVYKEFSVFDDDVNKQNQLFRLLKVNNWLKATQIQ